ncbi:MAG: cation transporter [Acidimicrobiales bacterium]|nr:cation transporter [Acidimicrobiales bacterium]
MTSATTDSVPTERLRRRVVVLAWMTIAWNVIEAVVAIGAGLEAGSLALVGFGLDSTIEVASAAVILWQFAGADEQRERQALRLIALSFFALAAYVSVQALYDLSTTSEPDASVVGIVLAALSLVVMPLLATAKRRTGRRLGSVTVAADSQQTWLCTYLSAVLLVGLVLNAALGWWWADPLAGLVIAALALREGREAWSGDTCCD